MRGIYVKAATDSATKEDFLRLPARLYTPTQLCQNPAEEEALLEGSHVLSSDFTLCGFVCYRGTEPVARCAVTVYSGDATAYLGFFESLEDKTAVAELFKVAEQWTGEQGCTRIVGPVNASFWIGYRMKTSHFESPPYFGEPYNPEYYREMWEDAGFAVCDRYVSNLYHKLPRSGDVDPKYRRRLEEFTRAGYVIRSPRRRDFDGLLRDVYDMIMALYADFPVFKAVSWEQFSAHYGSLRYVLGLPVTKIAYKDGKAVGFAVGVPDLGNRAANPGPALLAEILAKRVHCRRYVLLYSGVMPEHRGLGKALAQTVMMELGRHRATAIGAFIHEGKVTEEYGTPVREDQLEYLLFEKKMESRSTEAE